MEIPFASPKHASIVKQVIEVDAQLSPQAVKRELSVRDNILIAYARHRFPKYSSFFLKSDLFVANIGHFIH